MSNKTIVLVALAVAVVAALVIAALYEREPAMEPASAPPQAMPAPAAQTAPANLPPFHPTASAGRPYPKTLPPEMFTMPAVAQAYRIAQRIPEVLAQQPCYCWCDKFGHGSLLDCYATDHGAG